MLTAVENRLEELFEDIDNMDPSLVAEAEKNKEKERRMRLREEKIAAQKAHQEERVRKALERAKADPKKKVHLCFIFKIIDNLVGSIAQSIELSIHEQYHHHAAFSGRRFCL